MTQKLPKIHKNSFINGEWIAGSLAELEVINPANGERLATIKQCSNKETKEAIAAAKKSFLLWKEKEPKERAQILTKIGDLINKNIKRLSLILTIEQGKPIDEAKTEIRGAAEDFYWNAEQSKRIYGEMITTSSNTDFHISKEPIGVVGAITPWNFPFSMISRKIAPALAAGCTVVLKPAQDTPLTAISMFELFEEAGLPNGVANLIIGPAEEIGKELCTSPDINKITFTGSTNIGKLLYSQSSDTLKSLSMELGGNAPFIICDDVDIEDTVNKLYESKLRNNGQVCTSPTRIFIQKKIYKDVKEKLSKKIKEVRIGDGQEESIKVGPLIRKKEITRLNEMVQDALNKGAEVVAESTGISQSTNENGFYYKPIVLENIQENMKLYSEEIFGPIIPLFQFESVEEAIELANQTMYGLAAYVFTQNSKRVHQLSSQLTFGVIGINSIAIADQRVPFGGMKQSGFGRENGEYGIKEYLTIKTKRFDY